MAKLFKVFWRSGRDERRSELDVTPPAVSQVQLEKEKAERALRGEPPPACPICEKLLSWFLEPPLRDGRVCRRLDTNATASSLEREDNDGSEDPYWEHQQRQPQVMHLGTFEGCVASPCSQHNAILKYFQDNFEQDDNFRYDDSSTVDLAYRESGVCLRRNFSSAKGSSDVDPKWETFGIDRRAHYTSANYNLNSRVNLVLADDPKTKYRKELRVLDQKWVDLPFISQWIDDCFKSHGEKCENPMKIMRVVPDLLVDVRRKCVVEGKGNVRYMALSYRLGKSAPFRLASSDLDAFRKDAVLEDARVLEMLPLTVRHAILLAERLGFGYLWTDVLCIVHDGPVTLADQLNKMSAIYAGAATTIVATDGDGTDGILGLHGISGPRDLQQAAFPIRDKYLIIQDTERIQLTNADIDYNSRGWTYQEYIMSPRKLVFMNQQAYWSCKCCRRRESDGRNAMNMGLEIFDLFQFIRSGYPDLGQTSELLTWYNKRDLTYPGDALLTISGLLAVLSRGFEDGFLYGLPERFFDIGLGWKPCSYKSRSSGIQKTCRLRRGSPLDCKSYNTTAVASGMPSWSWTAWQGGFTFGSDEVARFHENNSVLYETSPITDWSTGSEPLSCNLRRIMSNWHADRKSADDQGIVLPEGWIRVEAEAVFKDLESEWSEEEEAEEAEMARWQGWVRPVCWRPSCYRHQSLEDEEPTFWWYPFRMPQMNESTPFKVPEQTRYLFCKTWKASVLLRDRMDWEKTEVWANDRDLRAGKSRIGRMWLHHPEQFDEEAGGIENGYRGTAFVDVVAISRSTFSGDKTGNDEDGWPLMPRDRINVLWVKWEQGIAYRVASGFVNEEDWNQLDREEIDLVLG
jgi:hypothetical protein